MRKPTRRMTDVMVRMFNGEEGDPLSEWTDTLRGAGYQASTLRGLIVREFVQVLDNGFTPEGLYLTKTGIAWLVDNKQAVMVEGRHILATKVPMSDIEIARHTRDGYLEAALYSQDVKVVGDYFNNVNRRADVTGLARPGGMSRQWEVVHQVKPYTGESTEILYLVVDVNDITNHLIVPKSRLTNLY